MFPMAFETLSASAEKSRATPPIPNTNTEDVPRINFRIIVISRVSHVGKSSSYYPEQSGRKSRSSRAAVSDLGQRARVLGDNGTTSADLGGSGTGAGGGVTGHFGAQASIGGRVEQGGDLF
jgi:hypothetical protein